MAAVKELALCPWAARRALGRRPSFQDEVAIASFEVFFPAEPLPVRHHRSVAKNESEEPEDEVAIKWATMSQVLDRLAERIANPDDFPVFPGSSLRGDDRASHPFEVSQAIRHLINASVDQLHGAKSLLHVAGHEHLAVGSTLARAALENTATALWILGPPDRNSRVERVLRWHARNYDDEASTVGHLVGDAPERHKLLIRATAAGRGLDPEQAVRGYKVTTPILGAEEFTSMRVKFLWAVASGFAHGRPWAYQGLLKREMLTVEGGHGVQRLTPRRELSIWLPLEAVHLLGELLRLRDRRAGLQMPPMPDGAPDHTELPRQ